MKIDGIPDSYSRSKIVELIKGLELDPVEVETLTVHSEAVVITTYALKRDGSRYWHLDTEMEVAKHVVTIPIIEGA